MKAILFFLCVALAEAKAMITTATPISPALADIQKQMGAQFPSDVQAAKKLSKPLLKVPTGK